MVACIRKIPENILLHYFIYFLPDFALTILNRLENELADTKSDIHKRVRSVQKEHQAQSEDFNRLRETESELRTALNQRKDDVERLKKCFIIGLQFMLL